MSLWTNEEIKALGTIAEGVRQAVENCLKVKAGDRVVVITDTETLEIGSALRTAAQAIAGPAEFFVMEDFGPRPIDFPPAIGEALAAATVSIYAAQGAPGAWRPTRSCVTPT